MSEFNTPILLTCVTKVIKVNRNSKTDCFHNLKIGDCILFSVPIKYVGTNCNGNTRPVYIDCYNCRTHKESKLSFNQLGKVLPCCELIALHPSSFYQAMENLVNSYEDYVSFNENEDFDRGVEVGVGIVIEELQKIIDKFIDPQYLKNN